MGERTRTEGMRRILVCIDSYDNELMQGRVAFADGRAEVSFDGLMQMLVAIEDNLNKTNFPQSYSVMRRFSEDSARSLGTVTSKKQKQGEAATFSVNVLFRQNMSWQGYVSWLDRDEEESFRSALELIFLMRSALSAVK